MSTRNGWNLLVFRDGRHTFSARELLDGLSRQIKNVCSYADTHSQHARDELIDALLRAGELECALEDRGSGAEHKILAALSDALARALITEQSPIVADSVLEGLAAIRIGELLSVSRPEGFCYYALHPLDYIDTLKEADIHASSAAVIGIRSIGTTLSAAVRAWFEYRDIPAERITVRPTGHPFDRKLSFSDFQSKWVSRNRQRGATFFIVDEGPGLSGSSFLSVAEALLSDVQAERIILLPSAKPDLESLIAENAASRWSKFPTLPLRPTRYLPRDATQRIDAGAWRGRVFASDSHWPGVWGWTERQKYFSADGRHVFRFDGHGHYGKAVRRRSEILAEHGWGPDIFGASDGFSVSPWVQGMPVGLTIDRQVLIQLARYSAFRAEHFKCEPSSQAALEEMARINLERALGVSHAVKLPLERTVIADGHMMPHEWIRSSRRLLKVDASSHGDDHFYPGPTDIAWDIAGAIAEWELDKHASELLISEYERASADNVMNRLSAYTVAYCAFRLAFTLSAAISVKDDGERKRFEHEAERYRRRLSGALHLSTAARDSFRNPLGHRLEQTGDESNLVHEKEAERQAHDA